MSKIIGKTFRRNSYKPGFWAGDCNPKCIFRIIEYDVERYSYVGDDINTIGLEWVLSRYILRRYYEEIPNG